MYRDKFLIKTVYIVVKRGQDVGPSIPRPSSSWVTRMGRIFVPVRHVLYILWEFLLGPHLCPVS